MSRSDRDLRVCPVVIDLRVCPVTYCDLHSYRDLRVCSVTHHRQCGTGARTLGLWPSLTIVYLN